MKVGFIGAGNIGSAILKGLVFSGYIHKNNINIFDVDEKSMAKLKEEYAINEKKTEIETG